MHTQEEKRKKENKNMKLYQVSPEKNTPIIHLLYIVKKNQFSIRTSWHINEKITDEVFREITAIQSCPISHE